VYPQDNECLSLNANRIQGTWWDQGQAWIPNLKQTHPHWKKVTTFAEKREKVRPPENKEAIEEVISGHEARNAELRVRLLGKGVDLEAVRDIECHFWAYDESGATSFAEALVPKGFRILVKRYSPSPKDDKKWNIEAGIRQSINLTLRREFTESLVLLAASHNSHYDGWGTSI
jgi:regulator of RNase E activity RraB